MSIYSHLALTYPAAKHNTFEHLWRMPHEKFDVWIFPQAKTLKHINDSLMLTYSLPFKIWSKNSVVYVWTAKCTKTFVGERGMMTAFATEAGSSIHTDGNLGREATQRVTKSHWAQQGHHLSCCSTLIWSVEVTLQRQLKCYGFFLNLVTEVV